MSRLISRDPFARQELHRETIEVIGITCGWCNNTHSCKKNGYNTLYQYYYESDSGQRSNIDGYFCSIGCMRSYHN